MQKLAVMPQLEAVSVNQLDGSLRGNKNGPMVNVAHDSPDGVHGTEGAGHVRSGSDKEPPVRAREGLPAAAGAVEMVDIVVTLEQGHQDPHRKPLAVVQEGLREGCQLPDGLVGYANQRGDLLNALWAHRLMEDLGRLVAACGQSVDSPLTAPPDTVAQWDDLAVRAVNDNHDPNEVSACWPE
ncbi:hypothetical protein [Euzebya pacifica]|uniref:hypothetical protein n=1 Tax=Euzebya pacifica TaxID=1608957 RepID=UPI0013DF11DB|nr:hypothetical protein [Euzebya pacifica]